MRGSGVIVWMFCVELCNWVVYGVWFGIDDF